MYRPFALQLLAAIGVNDIRNLVVIEIDNETTQVSFLTGDDPWIRHMTLQIQWDQTSSDQWSQTTSGEPEVNLTTVDHNDSKVRWYLVHWDGAGRLSCTPRGE